MALSEENQAFKRRLAEALRQADLDRAGPSRVAREFNLRYQGPPVSAQAVRKWLSGHALPSQDKLRVLAAWLEVAPHWLRFGEAPAEATRAAPAAREEQAPYRADYPALSRKFEQLNTPHKRMVAEMVLALLRLEGKS